MIFQKEGDQFRLLILISVGLPIVFCCAAFVDESSNTVLASSLGGTEHLNRVYIFDSPPSRGANFDQSTRKKTPVIGILAEVLRNYKKFSNIHQVHIVSSYVKWIESAGAQVVPILLDQDDSYYKTIFDQTNGILFPGGDNMLDPNKDTPMMVAAKKLYKLAKEANDNGDYYPIWGTCLGAELLTVLSSEKNTLEECSALDVSLAVVVSSFGKMFAPTCGICRLVSGYNKVIVDLLSQEGSTYNMHRKCMTDESLRLANLDNFYRPLAYSHDNSGKKFISILEAINYPFFGVQFHPEKPPFELIVKKSQRRVPHSHESVMISRYLADFFVSQAQMNSHKIIRNQIQDKLIYAYDTAYTGLGSDRYHQRYLFPLGDTARSSREEFFENLTVISKTKA